jgi:hypothetical protein
METYKPEDVLEAARSIRPELKRLLAAQAESVDARLAGLLEQARRGKRVQTAILELLSAHERTRKWTTRFLKRRHQEGGVRAYAPLPGSMRPVAAQKYVCPKGDYIWYRRSVAVPVPLCPTHSVPLKAQQDASNDR